MLAEHIDKVFIQAMPLQPFTSLKWLSVASDFRVDSQIVQAILGDPKQLCIISLYNVPMDWSSLCSLPVTVTQLRIFNITRTITGTVRDLINTLSHLPNLEVLVLQLYYYLFPDIDTISAPLTRLPRLKELCLSSGQYSTGYFLTHNLVLPPDVLLNLCLAIIDLQPFLLHDSAWPEQRAAMVCRAFRHLSPTPAYAPFYSARYQLSMPCRTQACSWP